LKSIFGDNLTFVLQLQMEKSEKNLQDRGQEKYLRAKESRGSRKSVP